jgi:hypothetical protein
MRYEDGSYDVNVHHDRLVDETHDGLELVRDVELGVRASQRLDGLEDEQDVEWRAEQARLEAVFRL